MNGVSINLIGQRFGRLIVNSRAENRRLPSGQSQKYFTCLCDCGTVVEVLGRLLRDGKTTSCGCFHKEKVGAMMRTHGMSNTRVYRIWMGIIKRCTNPNTKPYARYSTLGISDEFLDFDTLYAHVGDPPPGLSIDRKDNSKGYIRDNLKWSNYTQQARNTRRNVLLTLNGETHCVAEWCELLGIKDAVVHHRITRGWTDAEALTGKRNH